MSVDAVYVKGSDLADLTVTWLDSTGTAVNMATGYTFSLKVGHKGQAALFTKSSNLTGTSTGLTVAWATSGELNDLAAGTYVIQFTATRTADSKHRIQQGRIQIIAAVT